MNSAIARRLINKWGILVAAILVFAFGVAQFVLKRVVLSVQPAVLRCKAEKLFRVLNNDQLCCTNGIELWSSKEGVSAKSSTEYFKVLGVLSICENGLKSYDNSLVELVSGTHCGGRHVLVKSEVIWSIINKLPKDAPDNLPVILSRNIDVSRLSFHVDDQYLHERVRFCYDKKTVVDRSFVVVGYADGKVLAFRRGSCLTYSDLYRHKPLNLTHDTRLRYLAP